MSDASNNKQRWRSRDTPAGFELEIPPLRAMVLVGLFFMAAFSFGAYFIWRGIVDPSHAVLRPGDTFIYDYAELAGCVMGFALAGFIFVWSAFGLERITLGSGMLTIRREALGIGRSHGYDLRGIRGLRVARQDADGAEAASSITGRPRIVFEHGGQTVGFAAFLRYDLADQVVAALRERHDFTGAPTVDATG